MPRKDKTRVAIKVNPGDRENKFNLRRKLGNSKLVGCFGIYDGNF